MPIPNDYREIIRELKSATEEGRVIWAPSTSGAFVELPDAIMEIWGGDDAETDQGFVSCALRDPKDLPGGALRNSGKPIDLWFVEEGDADYSFMLQFLNSAKRQGLGVAKKLSLISQLLKSGGMIGKSRKDID